MPRSLYEQYFEDARARWRAGTTATVGQIRSIYDRALRDLQREIARRLPAQPSAAHLRGLERSIEQARENLTRQVIDATLRGIRLSVTEATTAAMLLAIDELGGAFEVRGIKAIYQDLNDRAVLAYATRTRFDGLNLSDRIWNATGQWKGHVQRALEAAVAQGTPTRDLARTLDEYLKPGVGKASSEPTRRRLKLPRDVSYQSVRVARTEMATAFKEGTILGHSRVPSYLGSKWELSAGHPFEDDCDDLASGGPNNDGVYPPGDEPMQPHPNCMCVLSPVHEDMADFADRLTRWIGDPSSDERLEAWFSDVSEFFVGRPTVVAGASPRSTVTTQGGIQTSGIRKAKAVDREGGAT